MAHIIVVGNEKGGSGKSTVSMHVSVALARMGQRVGAMDLDVRQLSFGRYIENRRNWVKRSGVDLPTPRFQPLPDAADFDIPEGPQLHDARMGAALEALSADCDYIVIDCPGSYTRLSQYAHSVADTLITPINDSFIDFDLLARTDPETGEVLSPSIYSEMVWKARQTRAQAGLRPLNWVVLRNRMGTTAMHNKRKVGDALEVLSRRIGFRLAPGFSERVVFRELFPKGLTLLDLRDLGSEPMTMSHVAARQELRDLMGALELPDLQISV
ncbi:division plane positioning ATPase MipZ [Roseinatronobacter bogoriensis]|uniref:ATPase n=1 Tax=Roseinatronobacter bogoriensis subsp. barguzinensis TaxID=441209 RepID=A0A2K8K5M6_9RHOB|nr:MULTISPECIES: division plane positioning ATPase MipZ [Rhodobaca]ATX64754.1 ATPase [Rhodobaca barguzinensis]MBB4208535.1 chromosome partitioning protein [Rhodobaca bogoriensis DSM 18756]TDW38196.1 chromosome partitioning protein [Rhodobaca barguzinensis]TDY69633.1 chromosome partitioning protein [Rhodobaca bogoriensis DSM 18756]